MKTDLRFWNAVLGATMVALVGLLLFDLLAPKPTIQGKLTQRMRSDQALLTETHRLNAEYAAARAALEARIWQGTTDSVGAAALAKATSLAKNHGLNLTAFRPQKPVQEGELTRLAFVMTLEGSYPALQAMVRSLETPAHRLSVHLVQVASADEASDSVNATVGVSAFMETKQAVGNKETGNGKA
jgi:Tfp pilus assembly protein PilO